MARRPLFQSRPQARPNPQGTPPETIPVVRITNTIRRLRFDRDEMTQQALAERIGVSRQTLIAIEAGKYAPSLELAFRIAHEFQVPLHEVFICEITEPGA